MRRIYLDNAATTPVLPEVVHAMMPFFSETYGNPSSIHRDGREAKEAIEDSRSKIASLLGAQDAEIVFTSGGTEADNLAVKGVARSLRKRGKHIITSPVEHHAILNAVRSLESEGYEITYLPVDSTGLVDPAAVEASIREDTILISVMHANNEIGTIEPIKEIGKLAEERDVYLHTDAVQSFGHIPTRVEDLGVSLLSTSAHKIYGPKGVGALYVRTGTKMEPMIHGGSQEGKRRASTENVPGIVGFGVAAELAKKKMVERGSRILDLRNRLLEGILERIDQAYLNGHRTRRLPGNINLTVRHVEGESMVLGLDDYGIRVSTGSACSSGELEPSHVLMALGMRPEDLHSSVRLSLGEQTTREDVDYTLDAMVKVVGKLRQMSPLYQASSNTP